MTRLALYRRNPDEFLRRLITVGETWIHHYLPESKTGQKSADKADPKLLRTITLAGKVMATVLGAMHAELNSLTV